MVPAGLVLGRAAVRNALPGCRLVAKCRDELGPVGRTSLSKGVGLDVLVEQFVRVELRAVAGQDHQAQPLAVARMERRAAFATLGGLLLSTAPVPRGSAAVALRRGLGKTCIASQVETLCS